MLRYRGDGTNEADPDGWDRATLPPVPYGVPTHGRDGRYHLLALEFDRKHGDAAGDAEKIAALCDEGRVLYVLTLSSGNEAGGRHLLIPFSRTISSGLAHAIRERVGAITITLCGGGTQFIRPPLAPHRNSGDVSWPVRPADPRHALSVLQTGNGPEAARWLLGVLPEAKPRVANSDPVICLQRTLKPWVEHYLTTGDFSHAPRQYGDKSSPEAAVTMSIANSGWSVAQYIEAVEKAHPDAFAKYRESHRTRAFLEGQFAKACEVVRHRPPTAQAISDALRQIQASAAEYHPGGPDGAKVLAVYGAHIRKALSCNSRVYHFPQRSVAAGARISNRKQVARCHQILQKAGRLRYIGMDRDYGSSTWELPIVAQKSHIPNPPPGGPYGSSVQRSGSDEPSTGTYGAPLQRSQDDEGADLWHPSMLGPGCGETWQTAVRLGQWASAADLAKINGHVPSTELRRLRQLCDHQMVVSRGEGKGLQWLVTGRTPADALNDWPEEKRATPRRQRARWAAESVAQQEWRQQARKRAAAQRPDVEAQVEPAQPTVGAKPRSGATERPSTGQVASMPLSPDRDALLQRAARVVGASPAG